MGGLWAGGGQSQPGPPKASQEKRGLAEPKQGLGLGLGWQPEWRLLGWLLWQGQRLGVMGYLGVVGESWLGGGNMGEALPGSWGLSLGCVVCGRSEPWVQVVRQADGSYQAEMWGHFSLQVSGDEPFRLRLLILFLRLLAVGGPERVIGRTRDDRAPFVRQTQIAAWFEVPQPNVSRWERYWLAGNWPDLLSLKTAEILTAEVRAEIIAVCAAFPWWGLEQVYHYLQQQSRPITFKQVRQAVQDSGWGQLRQQLQQRYHLTADSFRPRAGWLVGQLLNHALRKRCWPACKPGRG